MKKLRFKLIPIFLFIFGLGAIALSIFSFNNFTTSSEEIEVDITNINDFQQTLSKEGQYLINLKSDIEISETVTTGIGTYTIVCENNVSIKRAEGFLNDLIVVSEGATLVLGDNEQLSTLSVDGNSSVVTASEGSLIKNLGILHVLKGSTLTNNTSIVDGTAIYNKGTCYIDGGIISNNYLSVAKKYGTIYSVKNSKIYMLSGEIKDNKTEVSGCAIFAATGTEMEMSGGSIYNNTVVYGNGAAINAKDSKITITGGDIYSNIATAGGAIYAYDNTILKITNAKIYNNTASNGGAIAVLNAKAEINAEIYNNTATTRGGALYLVSKDEVAADVTLTGGYISSNKAENGDAETYGGGIYLNDNAKLTINNTKISSNSASTGGAIHMLLSQVTMEKGSNIYSNTAVYGAGLYINNEGNFIQNGGNICYNVSEKSGSAIFNDKGTYTLNDGSLSYNQVLLNNGGAINNKYKVYINGGTIQGNTGTAKGGAIHTYGTNASVVVTGGTFIDNGKTLTIEGESATLSDTPASSLGGAINITSGSLTIRGGEFKNNVSSKHGGAVNSEGGNVYILGGNFTGNSATSYGGAVHLIGATGEISGGNFTGNSGSHGGALVVDYNTNFTISGGTFKKNTASTRANNVYACDTTSKTKNAVLTICGGDFESVNNQYSTIRIGGDFTVEEEITFHAGIQADFAYLGIFDEIKNPITVKPLSGATETESTAKLFARIDPDARVNPYQVIHNININGYYLKVSGEKLLRTPCDYKINVQYPVAININRGANEGESVSFKALNGYEITNVKYNDNLLTAVDGVYTFTMPAEDVTITYDYTSVGLPITINENAQGLLDIQETANLGEKVEFSLATSNEYRVTKVYFTYNEKEIELISDNGKYSFEMFEGVELNVEKVKIYSIKFAENEFLSDSSSIILDENEVEYAAEGDVLNISLSTISTRYLLDLENSYYLVGSDETKYTLTSSLSMPAGEVIIYVKIIDIYKDLTNIIEVNNFDELSRALKGGSGNILINNDIEINSTIEVAEGEYTLIGVGYSTIKRANDFTGTLFLLERNATLNLGLTNNYDNNNTLTIDGNKDYAQNVTGSLFTILQSSTIIINPTAKLVNNHVVNNYAYDYYNVGSINAGGSAIWSYSGLVYLNGGEISGNSSDKHGGAIYNYGYVEINSGKITNNTTTTYGGAIYSNRAVVMNGGEISYNTATGTSSNAGAISFANSFYSTFTMNGGEIKNNSSYASAGALYMGIKGVLTINNGSFIDNTTITGNGGAIYLYGKGIIRNIYCSGNTALTKDRKGGAIYINGKEDSNINTHLYIYGGIFENNSAYRGGAISGYSESHLHIEDSTVEIRNNTATDRGGAIYLASDKEVGPAYATITSGYIYNNTAKYGKDVTIQYAVLNLGGDANLEEVRFVSNATPNWAYINIVSNLTNDFTFIPNLYLDYTLEMDNCIILDESVDIENVKEKVKIKQKSGANWQWNVVEEQLLLQNRKFNITIEESLTKAIKVDSYANSEQVITIETLSGFIVSNLKYNGIEIVDNHFIMPSEDVVITYDFELINYQIKIDNSNKKGQISTNLTTATILDEVVVTILPEEGYYIKQLLINGEVVEIEGNSYTFKIDKDAEISAIFEKIRFLVSFNYNYDSKYQLKNVEYGDTLKEIKLSRNGYTFGGWYTDKDLTNEFDFNSQVTKTLQLYAKWIKN